MWFWILVTVLAFLLVVAFFAIIQFSILRLKLRDTTERYVFITGCDTGFGNLLARSLDSRGVPVFAACLTAKGAQELSDETSSRLQTLVLDITDVKSVENAVNYVKTRLPAGKGLWGLVNNAGVMPSYAPLEMLELEDFEKVCNVNLFGTIRVTLAFLPMIRQSQGRIANMCSAVSTCAYPGVGSYCISKTGTKMFTTCLRRELFNSGVTLHSVEPGGFATNITSIERLVSIFREAYEKSPGSVQKFYGGDIAGWLFHGFKNSGKYISDKRHWVIDALMHALLAKHPKRTYLVGIDAYLFFLPLTYLPEWVVDYVLGWPKPYGQLPGHMIDWTHKDQTL